MLACCSLLKDDDGDDSIMLKWLTMLPSLLYHIDSVIQYSTYSTQLIQRYTNHMYCHNSIYEKYCSGGISQELSILCQMRKQKNEVKLLLEKVPLV